MSKVLLKPNGSFMLLLAKGELKPHRPTVFAMDSYFESQIAAKKILLVADGLSDAATDEEFEKFWKESDGKEELAVSAFCSTFGDKLLAADPLPVEKKAAHHKK